LLPASRLAVLPHGAPLIAEQARTLIQLQPPIK
jgi:hypothetical protein